MKLLYKKNLLFKYEESTNKKILYLNMKNKGKRRTRRTRRRTRQDK